MINQANNIPLHFFSLIEISIPLQGASFPDNVPAFLFI